MFTALIVLISLAAAAFVYFAGSSFIPAADGRLSRLMSRARRGPHPYGRQESPAGAPAGFQAGYFAAARPAQAKGAYGFIIKAVSKFIVIPERRRAEIDKKLYRAGYNTRAEQFYAGVAVRALALSSLIPAFILLDIKIAAAGTAALCFGLCYKWIGEPDTRLRAVSEEIANELPRFVSVIGGSMATDRDLMRTVSRYIKIARPALRRDLELLLLEMKAGNYADALRRFDARIGNPRLSSFVSGLIDAGRGVDQKTFFYLMEENMKQMFIENKKRELARRPAKVKRAIIAVGLCMFLLYLVPICLQLIEGISMFQ